MTMKQTDGKRRGFLRTFGLLAVAGVAAVLAGRRQAHPVQQGDTDGGAAPVSSKGYQLSEHVQRYYRSTRL